MVYSYLTGSKMKLLSILVFLAALESCYGQELNIKITNGKTNETCVQTVTSTTTNLNCSVYNTTAFNYILLTGWRKAYDAEIVLSNQVETIVHAMKYILNNNPDTAGKDFNIIVVRTNVGAWYQTTYKKYADIPGIYEKLKPLITITEKILLQNHTADVRVIGESFGGYSMRHFGEAHLNRAGKKLLEGHTIDPILHPLPGFPDMFPKTYFPYYTFSQVIHSSTAGFLFGLYNLVPNYADRVANATVRINGKKSYIHRCKTAHYGDPRKTFASGKIDVNICGFNFTFFQKIGNLQCSHQYIWIWYLNSMWKQAYCVQNFEYYPVGFYTNFPKQLDCVTTESALLPDTLITQKIKNLTIVGQGLWFRSDSWYAPWISSLNGIINGWVSSIWYKDLTYKNKLDFSSYLDVKTFHVLETSNNNLTHVVDSKNFNLTYTKKEKHFGAYYYTNIVGANAPPNYATCINRT